MTNHDSDSVAAIHRELHSHLPPEPALRVKALEGLLVEKGMLDSAAVDACIERYSETVLRWHRDLFKIVWRRKSRSRGGLGGCRPKPSPSFKAWPGTTCCGVRSAFEGTY